MFTEGKRGHLYFVALHPGLGTPDGIDFAIVRQRAEGVVKRPLREGVGRIALVEDRTTAFEPLILQIRVENAEGFSEEQALVDDRPAGQWADVEVIDLRSDHLLFDPAADEIQVLFKLAHVLFFGHGPRDHDLLDLRTRALRLFADDGDINRSEEHTSELQSLMRISYAVFFLTKKHHTISIHTDLTTNKI